MPWSQSTVPCARSVPRPAGALEHASALGLAAGTARLSATAPTHSGLNHSIGPKRRSDAGRTGVRARAGRFCKADARPRIRLAVVTRPSEDVVSRPGEHRRPVPSLVVPFATC